jgi:hypothetical protein
MYTGRPAQQSRLNAHPTISQMETELMKKPSPETGEGFFIARLRVDRRYFSDIRY